MPPHLTSAERDLISQMHFCQQSLSEIATRLGRNKSTISRELKRNSVGNKYLATAAQNLSRQRRVNRPIERKMDHSPTLEFVKEGLVNFHSPEQISGRQSVVATEARKISRQTISRWIKADPHRKHWESFLRRRGKRRPKDDRRGQLPATVSISGRPAEVDLRTRIGDWEGDTIIGPRKASAMLTMVERSSRYLQLFKLENAKASSTEKALKKFSKVISLERRKTVTFDQGKEFATMTGEQKLFAQGVYFAHPGCPWERGSNENANGLIRQFLPKGTDLSNISNQRVKMIEDYYNHRPRKCLGYRTPHECFHQEHQPNRCD